MQDWNAHGAKWNIRDGQWTEKAVLIDDWKKELTLVEGPFDLFKCDTNATCLLGSHFTEEVSRPPPEIKVETSRKSRKLFFCW